MIKAKFIRKICKKINKANYWSLQILIQSLESKNALHYCNLTKKDKKDLLKAGYIVKQNTTNTYSIIWGKSKKKRKDILKDYYL